MTRFAYSILAFLGLISTCSFSKLQAQYAGGAGAGYADSRYLGNMAGVDVAGVYGGGIGMGYAQDFRYGNLNGIEVSTMFDAGAGDGFADLRYLGSINGTSLAGMFGGGAGDGYDQAFTNSFLQGMIFPIELSYFDAFPHENQVYIQWTTESEVNHDFFTIERSREGQFFEELMQVEGRGGLSIKTDYLEMDPLPYEGKSWYRLKSTDLDGSISYSRTVEVNIGRSLTQSVRLFPNPYSGGMLGLQLQGFENNEILQLEIMDIQGRSIYRKKIEVESTDFRHSFLLTHQLPQGGYLVKITRASGFQLSKWLIVQ